jgi:four helix bundle protein
LLILLTINRNISIQDRTKKFATRIIKACSFLEKESSVLQTISKQMLRSGTSIGANCAEAKAAQSHRDFVNKLEISLKECRETQYWLEILIESELVNKHKFGMLLQESIEIGKILTASTKKLKEK